MLSFVLIEVKDYSLQLRVEFYDGYTAARNFIFSTEVAPKAHSNTSDFTLEPKQNKYSVGEEIVVDIHLRDVSDGVVVSTEGISLSTAGSVRI